MDTTCPDGAHEQHMTGGRAIDGTGPWDRAKGDRIRAKKSPEG